MKFELIYSKFKGGEGEVHTLVPPIRPLCQLADLNQDLTIANRDGQSHVSPLRGDNRAYALTMMASPSGLAATARLSARLYAASRRPR